MREIKKIIIHCSDSPFGCAMLIDSWHREWGWKKIGYHFIILNGNSYSSKEYFSFLDGSIEVGRPLGEVGAHVYGHNKKSVGICFIGENGLFTHRQYRNAKAAILSLLHNYDLFVGQVIGHCELDDKKPNCPGFDIGVFREYLNDNVPLEKICCNKH